MKYAKDSTAGYVGGSSEWAARHLVKLPAPLAEQLTESLKVKQVS